MNYLLTLLFITASSHLWCQCGIDKHNTTHESSWTSCSTSANPNNARGNTHWLMYDLDTNYDLGRIHIWNYNHPQALTRGVRDVVIDVSNDGNNWTEVSQFEVSQANGRNDYRGEDGPLLDVSARYVLITILSTYGDACAGISEIKIGVGDAIDCQEVNTFNGDLASQTYYAGQTIRSAGTVNVESLTRFQAPNEIVLNQGFEARRLAQFEILVGPCDQ